MEEGALHRFLEEGDRDFLAGFGRWSDDHADRVRERRADAKKQSKRETKRRAASE